MGTAAWELHGNCMGTAVERDVVKQSAVRTPGMWFYGDIPHYWQVR